MVVGCLLSVVYGSALSSVVVVCGLICVVVCCCGGVLRY